MAPQFFFSDAYFNTGGAVLFVLVRVGGMYQCPVAERGSENLQREIRFIGLLLWDHPIPHVNATLFTTPCTWPQVSPGPALAPYADSTAALVIPGIIKDGCSGKKINSSGRDRQPRSAGQHPQR